jgi:two-component sensor histidine kinase
MSTEAAAPRILYIDDDEGLRRLVARALQRRGYDVHCAEGGMDGVAMARAEHFDLVAVDHYMPGVDGLATLGLLRKLPTPPPVIYVTGSEESRIAVAALKAGAMDYVVKTVGEDFFDLLARTIEQVLRAMSLRAEKERAEEALHETNKRLQVMLHEVNHRVANSLQLVSAFVHMQARVAEAGARSALEDTQRRIAAIAQVHKRLYTSDSVTSVEMDEYLASLMTELEDTWSTPDAPRTLKLSAAPLRLGTDKAVAVGIIVSELVSNACKYAYPADGAGEVRVELSEADGSFTLRVEDDGPGLPADGKIQGTGLGTKLINAMAATLKCDIKYDGARSGVSASLVAAS